MTTENAHICPRCGHDHVSLLCESPVHGVWTVLQCDKCIYTWRTSEPARRSDRTAYPAEFRMTDADMRHAEEIPAVPPLKV